jgi:Mg2+/Co2+ transporter CorB
VTDLPLSALFSILGVLIMMSAFFSGSETALMTLNRYRLRHLKEKGHPGAIRAHQLLKRPDRLIGLILLGNNFVNILASSLATIIALRVGGEGAIAAAAGLLTLVILIFAEVAPKTLAALHPEKLAFPAAFVYRPLLRITYPLVWLVNLIANSLLKLLGVTDQDGGNNALTQEELRTVVMEAGALIPQSRRQMLLSILDLESKRVEEIMIPRHEVEGIDLTLPIDAIIQELRNSYYTRIPIFEGSIDQIVGVVHIRRAMHALAKGKLTASILREICDPPYFIPESTPLNRQLLNFQREKRHLGLIVDEYGDFLGLLTLADLLEEIVGEFTTDPADGVQDVQPQADGSYLVNGSANIRELVRVFDWDLPSHGPRTMNGLILEYMETIPEPGTSLLLNGYPIEILQTQGNMVKTVKFMADQRKMEGNE